MKSENNFTLPPPFGAALSVPTDLLIGGAWREGASGKRFEVVNPSTGETIASVADGDAADALAAVEAADKARAGWAATRPRVRSEILRRCFEKIAAKADALAFLISLENGKALADSKAEMLYAAEFFRWYAEEAVRIDGDITTAPGGSYRILVQYEPIGVALLITPWNFPAAMATRKIAPALAAGCTCVLKPAAETPLTALAIAELMLEAGVPPGVVNVVTTDRPGPLAEAVLRDARVRKLSFTGSTAVGRGLLRVAADQVISSSMELGGNAPFLVFDDANLSDALDGAMTAKMRGGGEVCIAANRFHIEKSLYRSFTEGIVERMSKVTLGEGTAPETMLGPMINEKAVKKIEALVEDALGRGAKLLLGGTPLNRPGFYYPPTVLADIPPGARLLKEEIFGPVVALTSFAGEEEAIKLANDTEFGLAAYVYTSDIQRGLRVCGKIESGMIALNRGLMSDPAAPFGGVKQSGLGREGAHHGLLEFTEAKYVAVSW